MARTEETREEISVNMDSRIDHRGETEAYRQPVDGVLTALGTDAERGLSRAEAQARLERYGRNELTPEKPVPAWRKFLDQFRDVLVILLILAALISAGLWLYERDADLPYEAIAILAVVLLNAIMGFVQQARAEQAVAALRQMAAAHATVIRDGTQESLAATELVPGDIVVIAEGDTVPADGRLIHSTALQMTGRGTLAGSGARAPAPSALSSFAGAKRIGIDPASGRVVHCPFQPCLWASSGQPLDISIDGQRLARYGFGAIRREKDGESRDVARVHERLDGLVGHRHLLDLFDRIPGRLGPALKHSLNPWPLDGARQDRVCADAVLPEFHGKRLREPDQAPFRGRIGRAIGVSEPAGGGGHDDDRAG
jgi:type II secretory pathway pseudopilin PulG